MGRWRLKLLVMLIVYAAGFATAVYVLAPVQTTQPGSIEPGAGGWSQNAQAMIDQSLMDFEKRGQKPVAGSPKTWTQYIEYSPPERTAIPASVHRGSRMIRRWDSLSIHSAIASAGVCWPTARFSPIASNR